VIRRLLALPVLGAALLASLAGPAAAATVPRIFHGTLQTSSNWAGYAVSGQAYKSISGSWTQPAASCSTGTGYAAFWVGLGGYDESSQALEQIGTESNCANGVPAYTVWYELVPAASVPVKLKLYPGNRVSASVTVSGSTVTVKLANLTRKTSFTKKLTMAAPDLGSAEWVAEAPSSCDGFNRCRVLPLANFGTVSFTGATTTTTAGLAGTISNPAWDATPIQLLTGGGGFGRFAAQTDGSGAVPGSLSADGSSFDVTWQQTVTPTPEPAPTDPSAPPTTPTPVS
jgi:Peptidase A4 family